MQWSSVVPHEYESSRTQRACLNDGICRIRTEGGFKVTSFCAFIDLVLSLSFLVTILATSPLLLAPAPPNLLVYSGPISFPSNNSNEDIFIPTNISSMPMKMTFHCEKIGRQVVLADFLALLMYTGGAMSVMFGALTRRATFCYMHFPCSLIAITIGIGVRIIEVIYCKWFLMRWLWFGIQFVWYSLGDAVAKSLAIYMEEVEHRMELNRKDQAITSIT